MPIHTEIDSVLAKTLTVLEARPLGGTILHLALSDSNGEA